MRILNELKRAVDLLKLHPGRWAVCGGIAASVYRKRPRFTDDIDFALVDGTDISAKELAVSIIRQLGHKEVFGFVPQLSNPDQQILGLVCARTSGDDRFIGIDFLLPIQQWIVPAVELAQRNFLDFGFEKLPTITAESLILAKLTALSTSPERFQDIDDIREIVSSLPIDYDYVLSQVARQAICVEQDLLRLFNKP